MKMKMKIIILSMLLISTFFAETCVKKEEGQSLIIQNNSNEKIIPYVACIHPTLDKDPGCLKPSGKFERSDYLDGQILPKSSKKFEEIGSLFINHPLDTMYIYLYNCIDIDNMSCEEFRQKNPIQKRWAVTKSDVEACNWTLVYP